MGTADTVPSPMRDFEIATAATEPGATDGDSEITEGFALLEDSICAFRFSHASLLPAPLPALRPTSPRQAQPKTLPAPGKQPSLQH